MNADVSLMPFSESLPGGGSTTFLVNLAREYKSAGLGLPIVSLSDHYTHREDFEAVGRVFNAVTDKLISAHPAADIR